MCLARVGLLLFGLVLSSSARTELLYQPPATPDMDATWRLAGFMLFSGIANANFALADLEQRQREAGSRKLDACIGLLRDASKTYGDIVPRLSRPRLVQPEKLSSLEKGRWTSLERNYSLKMPRDEQEAAELGRIEAARLANWIVEMRSKLLEPNRGAVRELFTRVYRVQLIGASTAELLETVRVP